MARIVLPKVMGHRGAAALAPENTLPSFLKAIECGLTWVEFDVMLTKDGVPVLFHDDKLARTTGAPGLMAKTPFARLSRLDAGGWFSPAFKGTRIPTLEKAIAFFLKTGLCINMEIKPSEGTDIATATAAVATLSRLWPADAPVPLISSFRGDCLEIARAKRPDWPRALIVYKSREGWRENLRRLDCSSYHLHHGLVDGPFIRELKSALGVSVACYTVNEAALARDLYAMGVDCLITDNPAAVLRAAA